MWVHKKHFMGFLCNFACQAIVNHHQLQSTTLSHTQLHSTSQPQSGAFQCIPPVDCTYNSLEHQSSALNYTQPHWDTPWCGWLQLTVVDWWNVFYVVECGWLQLTVWCGWMQLNVIECCWVWLTAVDCASTCYAATSQLQSTTVNRIPPVDCTHGGQATSVNRTQLQLTAVDSRWEHVIIWQNCVRNSFLVEKMLSGSW